MPNEYMVFQDSKKPTSRYPFQYKFHKNPKIRFWQLLFYLHSSTEIHSIFPFEVTDFQFFEASTSVAFDHLFLHIYFTKYDSKYLITPYFRRYKINVGPHDSYVNSYGEIENREKRVIGDSEVTSSNASLPNEIIVGAGWAVSKKFKWLTKSLLTGKYNLKATNFFFYRITRKIYSFFPYCKATRKLSN
jgi:hypothetical protein